MKIGLTGNIGCGKSTVASLLATYPDVIIIDCDRIAKDIIKSGVQNEKINALLGEDVFLGLDLGPNLKRIAEIIFTDPVKKAAIEALLHPIVHETVRGVCRKVPDTHLCIVESALIYETHWVQEFSAVVVVSCSPREQIIRLQERGLSLDDITRRLANQMPSSEKESRADIIIRTDCPIEKLGQKVHGLYQKLKEKFILTRAKKHWASLMSYLGNPKDSDEVFKGVVARYGKPGRYYHTLEHIVGMLDELFGVGSDELRLAIWFHDIMDDEKESAAFAKSVCEKWGLKSSLCRSVHKLILATTHETPPTGRAKLLTDLDLAILGKPEKEFDRYEENVRKEYSFVPDDVFSQKQFEILQYFLSRDFIYSTKRFQEKYESAARKNLERSIRKLEEKS
jgi:dephospho-CoA kinase